MAIFHPGIGTTPPLLKPVLTIGTFDGVHLGHRQILEQVMHHAQKIGGESLVVTFEPHPRKVLDPSHPLQILTPLTEKLDLIQASGIQHIAVTPFNLDFARQSADAYVVDFLVKQFQPAMIVIGYDHHFGQDRKGDIQLLQKYGVDYGFQVQEIPAHMIRDAAISSTQIREALKQGDVYAAAQMLGRPYSVTGIVVKGQQLGRTLGYPTVNLQPNDAAQLIPAQGVYAARVRIGNQLYDAMLSIGTRPTVSNSGQVSIEANIFDFSQDLYEQEISLLFIQRIRSEEKYDSLDALKAALAADEKASRIILLQA